MKVIVMVKATKSSEAGEMPTEEMFAEMGKFNEELVNAGIMVSGEGLHPSSKGKRVRFSGTDRTVLDGPFAETKELVAGFWIWNVKSLDEAVAWVKRCPNPMPEDSEIEIRQVYAAEDFGAEFTPELREQEAILRAKTLGLGTPRFEQGSEMLVAGLNQTYDMQTRSQIPQQWERFAAHLGKIPAKVGATSFGVVWNNKADCVFDYLSCVEVKELAGLPADFTHLKLPAGRFVVVTHSGHISKFPETIATIWNAWIPESGLKVAARPCVEVYDERFDPVTGLGDVEIWIPLDG